MRTYCDTLDLRHPGEHARHVRFVLERFTAYRNLAERTVARITPMDFDAYISARQQDTYRGKRLSARTVNNEIKILNAAFAKAGPVGFDPRSRRNYGYTLTPPAAELLPELRTPPVELTPDRVAAFVAATKLARRPYPSVCDPRQFWLAFCVFELTVPLRRRGALHLPRPTDARLELGEFRLPAKFNKEGHRLGDFTFRVPLTIAKRLAALPTEPGDPIFPWHAPDGRPYTLAYFNAEMTRFQREAGIADDDRITPQMFRSTVATLSSDTFGDAVGRRLLGHSATTNTINTHYKRPQFSDRCVEASDFILNLFNTALNAT